MLESHLQCETSHHLDLSRCKLNGTQDEVTKLQTEVRELRERENIRHKEIEERDQARQNHLERMQALQNHFEERVNVLTGINHRLRGDLNITRMALLTSVLLCSAVLIGIVAVLVHVLLGRLETKLEEQINGVQNELKRKVGEVEKIPKFNVTHDVRGQLMKDMNEVQKSLETKLEEQINGVQNKLKRKLGEVEKIVELKVTDVRRQLMKDMKEVKKSLTVKVEDLEESVSNVCSQLKIT